MMKRVQLINNLHGIDLQNIMECLTEHRGREHQHAFFRLYFGGRRSLEQYGKTLTSNLNFYAK